VTAHAALQNALATIDETVLAEHLRVSVPTLRRYAAGTLRMNWVITTRLLVLRERVVAPRDAYRPATTVRGELRVTRRTPLSTQVVAAAAV